MTGTLIAETNATGQTQKEYIWNDMEPVAQVDNEITYLHSDHLDTPRRGTDDLQTTVWQWERNAFGNTKPQIETTEVNLRFPGQYQDEETDLHYNWNRYYDAGIRRYVTSDAIGLNGGLNTYGYVYANPLSNFDVDGLNPVAIAAAIARAQRKACDAIRAAYKISCGQPGCKKSTTCADAKHGKCARVKLMSCVSHVKIRNRLCLIRI